MLPLNPACSPAISPAGLLPVTGNEFPVSFRQLREQITAVSGTQLGLAGNHVNDDIYGSLPASVAHISSVRTNVEACEYMRAASIFPVKDDAVRDAQIISLACQEEATVEQTTAAANSISFIRNTLPAMLSGVLRIGLATAAGRSASWAVKELLPSDMGAAAIPLAIAGSAIRSLAATSLCTTAAQSIASTQPRMAARAAAAVCGGLLLLPAAAAYVAPFPGLANAIALRGLSDIAYVLVRDPLQNCLRNAGPRLSLTRSDTDQSPHWPALSAAGIFYGLSAASWISLFEQDIVPGGCDAVEIVGPAAAIEATEAASATAVFSLFSGARYQGNLSIKAPQLQVITITAAMRLFATGILQLADLAMKVFFHSPGGLPFGICFLVMMSLEWVGGLAQQVLAHVCRGAKAGAEAEAEADDASHRHATTETTRL